MKKLIISFVVFIILISNILINPGIGEKPRKNIINIIVNPGHKQEYDFGDAPEGDTAIAYPSTGVSGSFPTCICCGLGGWIQHSNFSARFGTGFDFEDEGNAGLCPECFPPYNQDECFQDGDAGLIIPEPFTIDNTNSVIPCPGSAGAFLGKTCQVAVWGNDIDIFVQNTMPLRLQGYFNLIIDWNQNGAWGDQDEHVIFNFWPIPNSYSGPISELNPPNFTIGHNPGYVWARFTISEKPVSANWNGSGFFEYGETEDYLLLIEEDGSENPDLECEGNIIWKNVVTEENVTETFKVKNIGSQGSMLNWEIKSYPNWGTWSFSPSSGINLGSGSSKTVIATCTAPNQKNMKFTGDIKIENTDDSTDTCKISVELTTPRQRINDNILFHRLIFYMRVFFPFLNL